MSRKEDNKCGIIFFSIITFILAIVLLTEFLLPYSEYHDYSRKICNITNIEYPTVAPTLDNTYGWAECDCGKYCTSWSPCIKMYSDNHNNHLIQDEYYDDKFKECTFHSHRCPEGENLQILETYLIEANNTYYNYINKSVVCYVNDPITNIYLNMSDNWLVLGLSIGIAFALSIIILCCCCICKFRKKSASNIV